MRRIMCGIKYHAIGRTLVAVMDVIFFREDNTLWVALSTRSLVTGLAGASSDVIFGCRAGRRVDLTGAVRDVFGYVWYVQVYWLPGLNMVDGHLVITEHWKSVFGGHVGQVGVFHCGCCFFLSKISTWYTITIGHWLAFSHRLDSWRRRWRERYTINIHKLLWYVLFLLLSCSILIQQKRSKSIPGVEPSNRKRKSLPSINLHWRASGFQGGYTTKYIYIYIYA